MSNVDRGKRLPLKVRVRIGEVICRYLLIGLFAPHHLEKVKGFIRAVQLQQAFQGDTLTWREHGEGFLVLLREAGFDFARFFAHGGHPKWNGSVKDSL